MIKAPRNQPPATETAAPQPEGTQTPKIISLLDEIQGPIRADHLPCTVDRLETALTQLLEALPDFEGGDQLVSQLGAEMACLREAARQACHQANVSWTSTLETQRWRRWLLGTAK